MRLKKIVLDNIRSYKHQEIDFPEGSILLSGDIGSGKTSILLGIEFALFGLQPGQKGSSLLRNGENSGGVLIEFEIEGKEVVIERKLKRGKTISQDSCYIVYEGEKKEISVMELKSFVLNILNYPKEFSKKQNILYKFTVYTPQEEMKQIILQDAETRINTLRHVFGIDKYKRILENISILSSKIREEKRIKEALTLNLEQDRLTIVSKENELETKHYNLSSVEKELFLKAELRKKFQEEKDEVKEKIDKRDKFKQEIDKNKMIISMKDDSINNNQKTIEQLNIQISEVQDIMFDELGVIKLEQEIKKGKIQIEEINEDNIEISSEINSLILKNKENENIKKGITNVEICPTCLQDVDLVYKNNVFDRVNLNTMKNLRRIESQGLEKRELQERMKNIIIQTEVLEKKLQAQQILKIKFQNIKEKKQRIEELTSKNKIIEEEIEILDKNIEGFENSIEELSQFESIFQEKEHKFEEALRQERLAEIKVAELKKEIEVFSRQVEELKERILKTEEIKKQLDKITDIENWLSNRFSQLIFFIEKNVMNKLKKEFSGLFSEWFSMLVSETFNVKLDDDFTPIIEFQDYEIDYNYLSGGERTAIALAYRLALNQVINSLLSKIKTKDIVILDEPTDGFSSQQLDKMRDVLSQLNIKQLIIVSHEQKMEGFVDNVIRFRKENGISVME